MMANNTRNTARARKAWVARKRMQAARLAGERNESHLSAESDASGERAQKSEASETTGSGCAQCSKL